jgi:hypothetical protein
VLSESASYHGVVSFELGIYGESNK